MERLNVLNPGEYELLAGDVVSKMNISLPHRLSVLRCLTILLSVFGSDYVLPAGSLPIDLHNAPEPDICVTRHPTSTYLVTGNPPPSEMRLIIEVSDTTILYDRTTKAELYAQANIMEYWIVDINDRRLFILRQPTASGYTDITEHDEQSVVTSLAALNAPISVTALLP